MSGCCILFPACQFAGAVVAGVRLPSSVSSSSPVVAAVRVALARSQRLVALAPHTLRVFNAERSHAGPMTSDAPQDALPALAAAAVRPRHSKINVLRSIW